MGTTVVAALVAGTAAVVAHVGDSRMYRAGQRQLSQVTQDDSWAATLLKGAGDADPRHCANHPMRHVLTNVLGARDQIDVHMSRAAARGRRLLPAVLRRPLRSVDDARRSRPALGRAGRPSRTPRRAGAARPSSAARATTSRRSSSQSRRGVSAGTGGSVRPATPMAPRKLPERIGHYQDRRSHRPRRDGRGLQRARRARPARPVAHQGHDGRPRRRPGDARAVRARGQRRRRAAAPQRHQRLRAWARRTAGSSW